MRQPFDTCRGGYDTVVTASVAGNEEVHLKTTQGSNAAQQCIMQLGQTSEPACDMLSNSACLLQHVMNNTSTITERNGVCMSASAVNNARFVA
jgi:hypothetical protein